MKTRNSKLFSNKFITKYLFMLLMVFTLIVGCIGCNKDNDDDDKKDKSDKKKQEQQIDDDDSSDEDDEDDEKEEDKDKEQDSENIDKEPVKDDNKDDENNDENKDNTDKPVVAVPSLAREALLAALDNTFSENQPLESVLGLNAINEKIKNKVPYNSGWSFTLESISVPEVPVASMFEGLGFSMDSANDTNSKKGCASFGVTYGGTKYLTIDAQLLASKLYLMLPDFLNGSLSLNLETLSQDLNSGSFIAQMLKEEGIEIPEGLSFDLWNMLSSTEFFTTALDKIMDAYDTLENRLVVTEMSPAELSLPGEVSASTAYSMVIPKEAYAAFIADALTIFFDELETFLTTGPLKNFITEFELPSEDELRSGAEEMSEELGDITLLLAVTKDNFVSFISTSYEDEEISMDVAAFFTGNENPLDNIKINFSATDEDNETGYIEYTQEADADSATVLYNVVISIPDLEASVEAEGEYKNVKKGEKYSFDLNYLDFEATSGDEEFSFSFSGSTYFDTTGCNLKAPAAPEYEVLKLDEATMESLVNEIMTNIQNSPLISLILSFTE